MWSLLKILICIFLFLYTYWLNTYAAAWAINFSLTPIKYELDLEPGESITLPASIRNNGTTTVTMPTTASDFQASGPGWIPSIVRRSELVFPDQELASWITLGSPSVTLAPGEQGTINFTIDVPTNATPGGHYGAVLFQNANSVGGAPWKIAIDVDYGIILLIDVAGETVIDIDIWTPSIWGSGWGPSGQILEWFKNVDDCKLWDFTPSRYDRKCFWSTEPVLFSNDSSIATWSQNPNDSWDSSDGSNSNEPELFFNDFWIEFTFPIKNNGNTHVKPDGKVTIKDEDGNIIKAIGKELMVNDRGLITWEKIVDYIPINDQWGNILPKTNRVFESEWEGFPYKTYDDSGNQITNYWTPSEYYTKKNKEDAGFLMPWQRISEVLQQKKLTADIEIIYTDENGDPIEFNTAQEFDIEYIEQQVTLNPYVVLWLLLLTTAGIFMWFGMRWWFLVGKKSKCWNCKESIKSHWATCPYCKTLQDKKKHKKLQETEKKTVKPTKRKTTPTKKVSATRKTTTKKK